MSWSCLSSSSVSFACYVIECEFCDQNGLFNRLLEDLKDTLEQMELESRDHSTAERNKYMTRLRSYRTEAKRLEEEFHAVKYPRRSLQQDRMELLGECESNVAEHRQLVDYE